MFFSGRLHAGEAETLLGPGLDASTAQTDSRPKAWMPKAAAATG